jgi:multiple sugar transport system permease protein
MLPAAAFLILFLAYPLGLGVWLSFTDARIGRSGAFIGLENYEWMIGSFEDWLAWSRKFFLAGEVTSIPGDSVFWLSVFNTLLYTCVASTIKFAVGLYLALLLNQNLPFKAILRALVLLPFIVPTVLSTFAWRWMFDPTFSVLNWLLYQGGFITTKVPFLSNGDYGLWCAIVVNTWRGMPFFAITLLAGLQTINPDLHEAASLDGANGWHRFWNVTWPLLKPVTLVVVVFSIIQTFSDFQLIYVLTGGGPANATHLIATYAYQVGVATGLLGEGAAISLFMLPVLFVVVWLQLRYLRRMEGA